MDWSNPDHETVMAAVGHILDGLGLAVYWFWVEPSEEGWVAHVECDTGDEWRFRDLTIPDGPLKWEERQALSGEWAPWLADCRTRQ